MNERDKELAEQAGWPESLVSPFIMAKLKEFADLIRADAIKTANRAATVSWTLMCKKMVEFEREACAKVADKYSEGQERNYSENIADEIRARGNT